MAELVGLTGQGSSDTIRKMENGAKEISGPIQRIAKFMQEGVADGSMEQLLPEFLTCADLSGESEVEWVFHSRYPRFLSVVTESPKDGLVCASGDEIEWLSVAMWMDEPVGDPYSVVMEAAVRFAKYSEECC